MNLKHEFVPKFLKHIHDNDQELSICIPIPKMKNFRKFRMKILYIFFIKNRIFISAKMRSDIDVSDFMQGVR